MRPNYYGRADRRKSKARCRLLPGAAPDCPTCTILAAELLDLNNPREAVGDIEWRAL